MMSGKDRNNNAAKIGTMYILAHSEFYNGCSPMINGGRFPHRDP